MKFINQKGLSILEALISTAVVGIGFIAIFQMVNYSVNSISTSGERTKANYLTGMVAEGMIGYRDSVAGVSSEDQDSIYYKGGKAYLRSVDGDDTKLQKFAEYYMNLGIGAAATISPNATLVSKQIQLKKCRNKTGFKKPEHFKPINDPTNADKAQKFGDGPRNQIIKWLRLLTEDRVVKCKSDKDFKTIQMFQLCPWGNCDLRNYNIQDESMYVGRIQFNLNDGRKRKYLYFIADYDIQLKEPRVFEDDDEGPLIGEPDGG